MSHVQPRLQHNLQHNRVRVSVRVTGSGSMKGMPVASECSKKDGIKQRAGRCHTGHVTAYGPEPPHTNPIPPTGT
eukprot:356121-Chlamydomonas_euryale.AAC.4